MDRLEPATKSHFGEIFENLPIPIWEQDFSEVKKYLDSIPGVAGVEPEDFFIQHPAHLDACISRIRVVNINRAVLDLFGAEDKKELMQGMVREAFTPATLDAFRKEFCAVIRGRKFLEFGTSIKNFSGETRKVEVRWLVPPAYEKTFERVLIVMPDVTDRLLAEEAKKQSLQRLRQVIDLVPHMIFAKDLAGKFHLANKKLAESLGTNVDNLVGKSLQEFYPVREDLEKWKNEDEEVILTGNSMVIEEEEFVTTSGEKRLLHTTKIPFTEFGSNEEVLLGVALDITEEKRREQELKSFAAIMEGVFESSPDGIVVVHHEKGVTRYNQKFADIWGLPPEYLVLEEDDPGFQKFLDQLKNPEGLLKMINTTKSVQQEVRSELLEFRDGRVYEVHSRHYRIDDAVKGRIWFFHDITERLSTENELLERNFELDSFVYRASHDLKAPLNSIMGLIEISRGETDDPGLTRYLELMNRSVIKLDAFIRNLADFSSNRNIADASDRINFTPFLDVILENLSFMEGAQSIDVQTEIKGTGEFHADPIRLRIILTNLISNAIKYQDLTREDSFVRISIRFNPEEAIIRIEDNGIGIPEDQHEKVFRMFYRATVQSYGAGLGLYMVGQSVQRLGGTIKMESEPGKGTSFEVRIPSSGA